MKITYENLWKMNYIFNWPQLYFPDPYDKEIYQSTFILNTDDFRDKVDNYLNFQYQVFSERIRKELNTPKAKNYHIPESKEWVNIPSKMPYVKETPDIGRNDPCPCGSGKKYKKCCMNLK